MSSSNPYSLRNEDFIDSVDVVCTRCQGRALVSGGKPYIPIQQYKATIRFTCLGCGLNVDYMKTPKFKGQPNNSPKTLAHSLLFLNTDRDPYFGFELWYRIETSYGLLWAYNIQHLNVIADFIGDLQRVRSSSYQNNSIASRLPKWVSAAKNRAYLLRLIQRFKSK